MCRNKQSKVVLESIVCFPAQKLLQGIKENFLAHVSENSRGRLCLFVFLSVGLTVCWHVCMCEPPAIHSWWLQACIAFVASSPSERLIVSL